VSRAASVFTHRRPDDVREALGLLRGAATQAGFELRFDTEETRKLGIESGPGIAAGAPDEAIDDVDLAIVLGGDGTILTALRRFAGRQVPVFAVNFGQVGFLATIEASECQAGFARAFAGEFDLLRLPAIGVHGAANTMGTAINDVTVTRRAGQRVAMLAYLLAGEEVGSVRCDGVVVATPAGSTGYNLANGGPVLAWGVEGFAVSFIAPHSLTARALVVAPGDTVTIQNRSNEEPVDVLVDGRPAGELLPQESVDCTFRRESAVLAQVPGSTFYRRLREKFGHLV
jgi:NAD+ kinase